MSTQLERAIAAADAEIATYGAVTTGSEPRYQEPLYGPTSDMPERVAYKILEATKPRTITTVEELDALPIGSVVLTATGRPAHPFVASQKYDNNGDPIWHRGGRLGGSHGDYVIPATVLYEPAA